MRILFVVKTMDSRGGGAERVLSQITTELVARGYDVILVSFDGPDCPDFYEIDGRVRRIWLDSGPRQSPTRSLDLVKRVIALRRLIPPLKPDVAVGFMHSAYVPVSIALATTGIRTVGSEHIVHDHYAGRPIEKVAVRLAGLLLSRFTIVSDQARESFPRSLARKMVVIPNPVWSSIGVRKLVNRSKTILNVGRLTQQKDQRTLICAFAQVAPDYPEWRLRIVGEGELRESLATQARASGIGDRVELPGSTREIWREYANAEIFALSSTYESFGLATAEALAAGIPAVGFADCPGTNTLIQHGVNGLLVGAGNRINALAASLQQLIQDPLQRARMAAAAPGTVSALSVESIVDKWEQMLVKLTTRSARR